MGGGVKIGNLDSPPSGLDEDIGRVERQILSKKVVEVIYEKKWKTVQIIELLQKNDIFWIFSFRFKEEIFCIKILLRQTET